MAARIRRYLLRLRTISAEAAVEEEVIGAQGLLMALLLINIA